MKVKFNLSLEQRKNLPGYLFILPWLLGIVFFVAWPLFQSLMFSFHTIIMRPTDRIMLFVGWQNYIDIWIRDIYFVMQLFEFSVETITRVPVIVVISLILAVLINQKIKFQGLFRTIFFLPVIISSGPIMYRLSSTEAATIPLLNSTQVMIFLSQIFPMWMVEPIAGMFDQIIIILWFSGIQILIFLAGLQKISPSLYEAAKIDGASGWESFWKITLPTIKPIILVNLIYTLIMLANADTNSVIQLIMTNIFAGGERGYGFASAMAWMYTVILAFMLIVIGLFFKERDDKATRKYTKINKKNQRAQRRVRRTIARNDIKVTRKLKKQAIKEVRQS